MTDKFLTQRQLEEYIQDLEILIKNTKRMADNKAFHAVLVNKRRALPHLLSPIRDLQQTQWALAVAHKHADALAKEIMSMEFIK